MGAKNVSMGFMSKIHPDIQKNMYDKLNLARGDLNSQSVRSVWIKMTSGGTSPDDGGVPQPPVILMGGELDKFNKLKSGLDGLYDPADPITEPNQHGEVMKPLPGISSCDCKTDGEFGSLKKATIKWQCWSMEDLGRLTPHFMNVGRSCMVEWGWSASPGETLTFSPDELDLAAKEGKKRVIENGGNYEVVSGVIKDFSWESNEDGGFDCSTEIISHGTPMVESQCGNDQSLNVGAGESESEEAAQQIKALGMSNLKKYMTNIRLQVLRHMNPGSTIEDPWYWGAGLETEGGTIYSKPGWPIDYRDGLAFGKLAFISWGYFEDNILSKYMGRVTEDGKTKYTFRSIDVMEDDATGDISYESVKISNHPELITTDARICIIPGQHLTGTTLRDPKSFPAFRTDSSQKFGYLRRIKLNCDFIRDCWNDAETIQEGLEAMFKGINDCCGNIFDFRIMADDLNTANLRVVDMNVVENTVQKLLRERSTPSDPDGLFYFPYWRADNSIVRTQTLKAKIPNSSMYAALYGSNTVRVTKDKPPSKDDAEMIAMAEGVKSIITDKFLMGFGIPDALDPDGKWGKSQAYMPGNHSADETLDVAKNIGIGLGPPIVADAELEGTVDLASTKEFDAKLAEAKKSAEEQDEDKWFYERWWDSFTDAVGDLTEFIGNAFESLAEWGRAALTEYETGEIIPAHKVAEMVHKINYIEPEPIVYKNDYMLPLELSLEIDGQGGIFPGNAFSTDYIQESYRPHTLQRKADDGEIYYVLGNDGEPFLSGACFMVKGVEHSVSSEGWTTSFEGIMRASIPPPSKKHGEGWFVKDGWTAKKPTDDELEELGRLIAIQNAERTKIENQAVKDQAFIDQGVEESEFHHEYDESAQEWYIPTDEDGNLLTKEKHEEDLAVENFEGGGMDEEELAEEEALIEAENEEEYGHSGDASVDESEDYYDDEDEPDQWINKEIGFGWKAGWRPDDWLHEDELAFRQWLKDPIGIEFFRDESESLGATWDISRYYDYNYTHQDDLVHMLVEEYDAWGLFELWATDPGLDNEYNTDMLFEAFGSQNYWTRSEGAEGDSEGWD